MTHFSVRLAGYDKNPMLNICDAGLLGRDLHDGSLKVSISQGCYGQKRVGRSEAAGLLESSAIINMAGEETVSLSLSLGIGSASGVRRIDGVPFLIVFKM